MACITSFAPTLAMATTKLARALHYEAASTFHVETHEKRAPLRVSWVVTTDNTGNRRLQMQWSSNDDR
jgi:hypothetical protein